MRGLHKLDWWASYFAAGWAAAIAGLLQFLIGGPAPWFSPWFMLIMGGLAFVSTLLAVWKVPVGPLAADPTAMRAALLSALIFSCIIGAGVDVLVLDRALMNPFTIGSALALPVSLLMAWFLAALFSAIFSVIAAIFGVAVFDVLLWFLTRVLCSGAAWKLDPP
jgi:hypothetical protein